MKRPSILTEILQTKAEEVSAGKAWVSQVELRKRCRDLPPFRGFQAAMLQAAETGPAVIAEIKKASPSAGVIREHFVPAEIAATYAQGGAACLSVLTDEPYFQGHRDFLMAARVACELPLLRKDFIVDEWQVWESACLGADCILLIVAALQQARLVELHGVAREIGLDVLVEVHDEGELEKALKLPDALIGVNNRNLHTFTTDLETSERLRELLPADRLMVTESGIRTAEDIQRMLQAGIRGFLVGEAFMRAPDPGLALKTLFFGTGD